MALRVPLLVLHGLSLASAASWHLEQGDILLDDSTVHVSVDAKATTELTHDVTDFPDGPGAVPVYSFIAQAQSSAKKPPCIADLPGGRWTAGATMAGGIAVSAAVSIALMYYLMRKKAEALALPVSTAAPSAPANDTRPPGDAPAAEKPVVKKKRVYMYSLDGLRTILVTCVIFAHYPVGLPAICKHFLGWPMQFFFVLSGFVAMCAESSDGFTWVTGLTYILRRLFRILPLYQLALVFQYALSVYAGRDCQPVIAWPMNALLLQVILPVPVCGAQDWAWTLGYTHFNGNGPAWFAACIVWFSILFPVLYNARIRAGGVYLAGALVALIALRALPDLFSPAWGTIGTGFHLYAMSPIRLMEYAAGMWAAQLAGDIAKRWGHWGGWCWAFDASVVVLVAMIYAAHVYWAITWRCSGDYHLTAICCLVCMVAKLAAEMTDEQREGAKGAVLHRIIGSTPLSMIARFSFPAYIFQTSFMGFTQGTQDFYLHRFVLLWVFSVFATIYIEEPAAQWANTRMNAVKGA